jgi:serine/threonine-protein kinase HipA
VSQAKAHWPKLLQELKAPQAIRDVIIERLKTLPLAQLVNRAAGTV